MKREKARLEALRCMPYDEYVQTPEWQETQKAAIKRAGNRCQVCTTHEGSLSAYHTTYESLGCEQENDIIVLCEACYALFIKNGRLTRNDDMPVEPETGEEETYTDFSFMKKATIFGSSAAVTMGLPLLLHAPLPAEVFGFAAAIALAANSPKLYGEIRDSLPQPVVELIDGIVERKRARETTGEWSTWDRLCGRHMHAHAANLDAKQANLDAEQEETDSAYDDYLDLGPTLKPHADSLLSGRKVILGTSGSGKTNATNVYCEELAKLDPAPAIILFDTDDENRELCNRAYLPNPLWLDESRGLTAENAFEFAQFIIERRYQCIINLHSYEDEEAAWIMINMVKGVRAWEEAREVRIPCEIVLDEASVWLPQNPRESSLSSLMVADPDIPKEDKAGKKISLLALLQRVFFTTVRRGRRRGMGFTLAAQRIAEIDKRALQGSWLFLMRQTQPADFREYARFGISSKEAMELLDGEAFVFAPGSPREKHRLRVSDSPHGGVTPGMQALRESTTRKREAAGSRTAELLAATVPEPHTSSGLPASDRPRLREIPRKPEEAAPRLRHPRTGLPTELRDALNAYTPGMTYRELGALLGYGDSEAREIFSELKKRGMLRSATGASEQGKAIQNQVPHLRPLPRPGTQPATPMEDQKPRSITAADLAKAFALWQAGASSVRKLEAAAKAAGYSWSNGKVRSLIEEMRNHGLIQGEQEQGVL